jgi:hypothetical protein
MKTTSFKHQKNIFLHGERQRLANFLYFRNVRAFIGFTMPDLNASEPLVLGQELVDSLTAPQIKALLGVVAKAGVLESLGAQLQAADSDMATTVQRLLARTPQGSATDATPPHSTQKILESWQDLWDRWDSHVSEVGDEEGAYASQEHHWEPPCFDPYSLSDDLDQVAKDMLNWIGTVHPLVCNPDLFLDALTELDDAIESYPEWMNASEEPCVLGNNATRCVLEWTWRSLQEKPQPGAEFLQRIRGLDNDLSSAGLSLDECSRFFATLPEEVCREIYRCLSQPEYDQARADRYSVWHRIHFDYEGRFDMAAYLRTCEAHLAEDYQCGRPLTDAALARGDYVQADRFLAKSFASLLRVPAGELWHPESSLLPENLRTGTSAEQEVMGLLKTWEEVAHKQGNSVRAACCHLQRVIVSDGGDWKTVLCTFDKLKSSVGTAETIENLFRQWQERTVAWCLPWDQPKPPLSDSWIYWLIESTRDPVANQKKFLDHLDAWLECLHLHQAFVVKDHESLVVFTRLLPSIEQIKKQYPTFCAEVLAPVRSLNPVLEKSLREALADAGADSRAAVAVAIWQKHLQSLAPDPGRAGGSNYTEQAIWMKALLELNCADYEKLLAKWRTDYKRRRNLWAEMSKLNLPGV